MSVSATQQRATPESALYAPVLALALLRLGTRCLAKEVPVGRKKVDLVGLTHSGHVLAVEFKMRDWRRALWQASVNQLFAEYSYVAVWHGTARVLDRQYLERQGIGLISVHPTGARVVMGATRSRVLNPLHRRAVTETLMPRLAHSS